MSTDKPKTNYRPEGWLLTIPFHIEMFENVTSILKAPGTVMCSIKNDGD